MVLCGLCVLFCVLCIVFFVCVVLGVYQLAWTDWIGWSAVSNTGGLDWIGPIITITILIGLALDYGHFLSFFKKKKTILCFYFCFCFSVFCFLICFLKATTKQKLKKPKKPKIQKYFYFHEFMNTE